MNKLRVGVIGTGYLGKFHTEKYAGMDEVELVGIVDIEKERAENIAASFGISAYTNYKNLFGKVDAVSIVVPTPVHFAVSKDFLENDINVLIEKPITTTIEEADELIKIAESKGLIIQVGHLERFNPAIAALQDIVKNPRFIESHRLSIYNKRGTDVSVVLDLMIHDIDIILNFVSSRIKTIHAAGIPVVSKHVDIANARLEFENGCVANITASRISTKNERKIRLFQRDASISVDFANHETTVISQNKKSSNSPISGMEIKQLRVAKSDALKEELKSFVESVQNHTSPKVTGQMGRDALKTALDIMKQINISNKSLL